MARHVHIRSGVMLYRFKTSRPSIRILLGFWPILEVISIPSAAQVTMRLGPTFKHEVFVSGIQNSRPGVITYMVTHSSLLDVATEGMVGELSMLVHRTKPQSRSPERHCMRLFASGEPQLVFSGQPERIGQLETRIFTLSYNVGTAPAVEFKERIAASAAMSCARA